MYLVVYFSPVVFSNIVNTTILQQFLYLKLKVLMCVKYWCSHAVFKGLALLLSWKNKFPLPLSVWQLYCQKTDIIDVFQTCLFDDLRYTILNEHPI